MLIFLMSLVIGGIVLIFFTMLSKSIKWESIVASIFECGFTSYFFSRFSISNHYFIIGMIFLFLDLELCVLFPFFNQTHGTPLISLYGWIFALTLLLGLMAEWWLDALNWFYWT